MKLRVDADVPWTGLILLGVGLFCAACSNQEEARVPEPADSATSVTNTPPSSEPRAETDSATAISQPTVIFVEATEAEIEAARKGVPEEDFAVIADDMMFYRSTAIEQLEAWRIPFSRLTGRRPMQFMVNGAPGRIDFKDVATLDFIIVYRPNEKPRTFAPIDIEEVRTYWQSGAAGERRQSAGCTAVQRCGSMSNACREFRV
jgi:hypothetical protein